MAQMNRIFSFENIKKVRSEIDEIKFRNIGPTVMSGRVTDIAVNPSNTQEFYVAYASGGLWHTVNNGQSFVPLFDGEATMTIGAIAVEWQSRTIWVGTGEVNSSRSSYAGVGMYKSEDSGKTWMYKGLEESHHIGKIILHPKNKNIAWVAVLGHLYSANKERGLYKTADGGNTWKQTLYINDSTGCVDMAIDANNADVLYTTTWTRSRSAWNFNGVGSKSGIYKSVDGGMQWQNISAEGSGFVTGNLTGRIGISVYDKNPNIMYALVDNNNNQPKKDDANVEEKKMGARDLLHINKEAFLNMDNKKITEYLKAKG